MRVGITGATGFIGRRLCHALLERGDEAIAITRDAALAERLLPSGVQVIAWGFVANPTPGPALPDVDAIVHLAGASINGRWSRKRMQDIYESRILGTRNLVAALEDRKARPRVFVGGSAIGYYGDRGDDVLDEDAQPGEGFLAEVCRDWEAETMRAEALGLRVVRIRTGLVLGPDGGVLSTMRLPYLLGLGGPMGGGRQWMSWVHLDDEVGLILHALDHQEVAGALNAVAPAPAMNKEFAGALGEALRRPAFVPLPSFALRLALGRASELVLASQRVRPARALATGYHFRHPSLRPALEEILQYTR